MHRCTHFNSRLRKSASLEDTFLTKWCSRLSAVLILTNDSFQNLGFGLVCVTPTAQNGVLHVVQHVCFYGYCIFFAPRLHIVPIFATHAFIPRWPPSLGSNLGALGAILASSRAYMGLSCGSFLRSSGCLGFPAFLSKICPRSVQDACHKCMPQNAGAFN